MKTLSFESREDWLDARRGKITGTRVKDLMSANGKKKAAFYELIAERVAVAPDDENPMERGARLEEEALKTFSDAAGKELDTSLIIWTRDDNDSIAVSPDAFVIGEPAAVEVKCLSSAKHIETFLTQKMPSEYESQVAQYFVVNDELERVYMVFYDPRVTIRPFFYLTITREEVAEEVAEYLAFERDTLKEVQEAVVSLTF